MSWAAVRVLNSRVPRLFVHVEGPTEESFVNAVLSGHLYEPGSHAINAKFIGGPWRRSGVCGWLDARKRKGRLRPPTNDKLPVTGPATESVLREFIGSAS